MSGPVKVLIADTQPLFRVGVVSSIGSDEAFRVIGQTASGEEAMQLTALLSPDIVLIDISIFQMESISRKRSARHPLKRK
ncbi:MAG: hypothetical protein AAAB35_12725 [Phyllobacterium sp.]|uniref:hypothetical protein n=1 Tax=Phyllobacterium sp. TaxID=1871046 RepID=UPI0030F0B558